jgi:hypothetical protein
MLTTGSYCSVTGKPQNKPNLSYAAQHVVFASKLLPYAGSTFERKLLKKLDGIRI